MTWAGSGTRGHWEAPSAGVAMAEEEPPPPLPPPAVESGGRGCWGVAAGTRERSASAAAMPSSNAPRLLSSCRFAGS